MSKERLYLFDTTLRDGAQTTGVDFSVEEKRRIAAVLDDLGIDYIEGGYPGANATDTEFLSTPARFEERRPSTAFGMTKRAGPLGRRTIPVCRACSPRAPTPSASSPRPGITTSASPSASPTRRTSKALEQSVKAITASGREAMIDCEHFFDGYKGNREYALAVATHGPQSRRTLGRAVRHQRRHAAARGGANRRRGGQGRARRAIWASTPTMTPRTPSPTTLCRRARRLPADPRRAQRARRALRQRQPHLDHPDAAPEERVRGPLRDTSDAGAACRR